MLPSRPGVATKTNERAEWPSRSAIINSMKRKILIIFCTILTGLLVACGGDDPGPSSESNSPDTGSDSNAVADSEPKAKSSSARKFTKNEFKNLCDILDPVSVSRVAGVDDAVLEQMKMSSMCIYSWDGGQANFGMIRIGKNSKSARTSFENSYKNMSGEEVAEGMAAIGKQVEKQSSEGKTDVKPGQAKAVTGAMAGAFAGGLQYEDIDGLGDVARFETTRSEVKFGGRTIVSYANSLNVLVGNLKFTVSFSLDEENKHYRDENIALARAVIENLPD